MAPPHGATPVGTGELAQVTRRQLEDLQRRLRLGERPSQETLEMAILGIKLVDGDPLEFRRTVVKSEEQRAVGVCHVTPATFDKARRRVQKQVEDLGRTESYWNLRPVLGAAALVIAAASQQAKEDAASRSERSAPAPAPVQAVHSSGLSLKEAVSEPSDVHPANIDLVVSNDESHDGEAAARTASPPFASELSDSPPRTPTQNASSHAMPRPDTPPSLYGATPIPRDGRDTPSDRRGFTVSGLHETDKAKLKMIVSAYAVREEGLAGKTLAATAEARRYHALLKKQENENASRKKKQEKALEEAREAQASLRDQIAELSLRLSTMKEGYETKIAEDETTFKNDLERIESIYKNQVDALLRERQRAAEDDDHLQVRSREELVEAGRRQERERCERMIKASCESKKRVAEEKEQYHKHVLHKERGEREELRAELARLEKSSAEEVKALRKQVEYLFEYARNLTRMLAQMGFRDHRGAPLSTLSRKKYRKPINAPVGVDGLDFALLSHIQTCWFKTQQYLLETRGVHTESEPSLANFPLTFVSSADFCDATAPRGVWTKRAPSKDAVDALIRNLEATGLTPGSTPVPDGTQATNTPGTNAAPRPATPFVYGGVMTGTPTARLAGGMRTPTPGVGSRPGSAGLRRLPEATLPVDPSPDMASEAGGAGKVEELTKQVEKYRQQFQAEVARSKEMRLVLESQNRALARLRQMTPSKPVSSLDRPPSSLAGKRRPMSAAAHRRMTPTELSA
eukprot:TRINITY_DN7325_c0_g2_i1.p1 TRINITY_DN7325_c0_g2~~TRINITY_DN7325_c0_g2_i1.p1  ORF type:complete len:773 (+),score=262.84 TRINITY_DN7325_c0_g2_i1:86-2320(+)